MLIGLFGVAEGLYRYLTGLAHEKAEQEITWLVPDSGLLARILLSLGSSVVWFFVVYVAILVVGLIGARFWARSIDFPPKYLCPVIFVLSLVGAFALRGNVLDVWITIGAGVLGYLMRTQDYPLAPMVLGLVLGPIAEVNLRRALTLSDGSLDIFLSDPLTFAILVLSVVSLLYPVVQQWRTRATA